MNTAQHNTLVSFIWGIADDVLRDVYVRGKYRDVILPMTVIRRLDALLEAAKDDVLRMKTQLDAAGIVNQEAALCNSAGENFYNTSQFTLRRLLDNPSQLQANFEDYLNGFSPNVIEIIGKFDFHNNVRKLAQADVLGHLIDKFLDKNINLSPKDVLNADGEIKLPGLSNLGMGYVFEELIRRFNEENNEEAGEHFTPRDIVRLMTSLAFLPVKDIKDSTYKIYDCACGTGGMLTEADAMLTEFAEARQKEVRTLLFGQEVNAETYAICKADLLIKGEEERNIAYGSTLSADAFPGEKFDFQLANPPYGKSWKTDLDRLCGGDKKEMRDRRFVVQHDGNAEFPLITRSSDGQLMFLVSMLSKMNHDTELGSRVVTVHNGSSLFTGDAGQGESNIRQWIIENDWLEAIIGVPENMFYNTGIATYIWVLSNRKPEHRRGRVQLINAANLFTKLRKNLGKKNCELSEAQIKRVVEMFLNFEENDISKIFDNADFGYRQITVERPLRLRVEFSAERFAALRTACAKEKDLPFADFIERNFEFCSFDDYNVVREVLKVKADECGVKLSAKRWRLFRDYFGERDESAAPVIADYDYEPFDEIERERMRLYGLFKQSHTSNAAVRYEPDAELRDYENVPLKENVEDYFRREVLPHTSDAWIDEKKTVKGYEISFTKYFYRYEPLRDLSEITGDLLKLERETDGLLKGLIAVAT